jgi:hypothetical protein
MARHISEIRPLPPEVRKKRWDDFCLLAYQRATRMIEEKERLQREATAAGNPTPDDAPANDHTTTDTAP